MDFDTQVVQLSSDFFSAYPSASYPELLAKASRPYNCLLVETHYDFFICLPYRSHIKHRYSFRFRESKRSASNCSGIDYTKMVIVQNPSFIADGSYTIDQDEYRETMKNIDKIVDRATKYLEVYMNHMNRTDVLSQEEFSRLYSRSTLKYFNDVLGVNEVAPPSQPQEEKSA